MTLFINLFLIYVRIGLDISQCILGRGHHFNGQEFLNVYRDKQTHEKTDGDKVDFVAQVRHLEKE